MGKTAQDAVKDARTDVAKTVARAMRALRIGIGSKSTEQIQAGFAEDQRNAPMWVHASLRLGAAFVTSQGQNATPSGGGGLAVVVVAPAQSVVAWQEQAEAFRIATAPKSKVIDAAPVASVPVTSPKGGR